MASPKPVSPGSGKEESPPAPSPPRQNENSEDATPTRVQEADDSSESQAHDAREQGEISDSDAPPLPNEPLPATVGEDPPLPNEPAPPVEDDGWDYRWEPSVQNYIFFNRFTGQEQLENPRIPGAVTAAPGAGSDGAPTHTEAAPAPPVITGYNPAIHGDYDPNAWYAKGYEDPEAVAPVPNPDAIYESTALFNRFTGQYQTADQGPARHSDEAKAKRQMNAYFDVDDAANLHDGRSLKAERAGKKPTKSELKAFKEKRKARKEEKRRAWLRD